MKGKGGRRGISEPAKKSRWLRFLIDSKRWKGLTQTEVARSAETKPCNLSAFISSEGQVRNLSKDRLTACFNFVGMHVDGLLTAGLHRWDLLSMHPQGIQAFKEIIKLNPPMNPDVPGCLFQLGDEQCFFIHRPTLLTTVMAKLPADQVPRLKRAFDTSVRSVDACAASELQSLWLTEHDWIVNRAIDTYLGFSDNTH